MRVTLVSIVQWWIQLPAGGAHALAENRDRHGLCGREQVFADEVGQLTRVIGEVHINLHVWREARDRNSNPMRARIHCAQIRVNRLSAPSLTVLRFVANVRKSPSLLTPLASSLRRSR